ncbi:MAG: antitoxin [Rhizobacter sp.]|nr:antitoxin [Chlorobiales bacterium]
MQWVQSYIVDESGEVKSVVVDYATFKKIEALLLDDGLAKAMLEAQDDDEVNLEDAKKILGFRK